MAKVMVRRFATPDETRPVGPGRIELLKFGEGVIGRAVLEPGWRWSKHVKPIAGTASCMAAHAGYVVSGRMHVLMDDGLEADIGPGDYAIIPPGHDAWIVGNDPFVFVDIAGMEEYGRAKGEAQMTAGTGERPAMH